MEEPKVIQIANLIPEQAGKFRNPQRGRIYNPAGIAPCIDNMGGGNREPKIVQMVTPTILGYTRDDKGNVTSRHEKEIAGTLHASTGSGGNTDQFVKEVSGIYDNQFGEFAREPIEGMARTLKADHHNAVLLRHRIRKLTERECFRLMDVSDSDIDKIEARRIKVTLKDGTVKEKPIPKSAKYKLAGNSIVVSCLYHIFHQMFIAEPPEPKPIQKSLFDL